MGPRALVIEADPRICKDICRCLAGGGFETVAAADAGVARAELSRGPAVVLLDPCLPGAGAVYRDLQGIEGDRRRPAVVLLQLSTAEAQCPADLLLEADDCIREPFVPGAVVRRVWAALWRRAAASARPVLRVGGLTIHRSRVEARLGGHVLPLRAAEFRMLTALAESAGAVLTRDQLCSAARGRCVPGSACRAVDVHVSRIRATLSAAGAPPLIDTVLRQGYRLRRHDAGPNGPC